MIENENLILKKVNLMFEHSTRTSTLPFPLPRQVLWLLRTAAVTALLLRNRKTAVLPSPKVLLHKCYFHWKIYLEFILTWSTRFCCLPSYELQAKKSRGNDKDQTYVHTLFCVPHCFTKKISKDQSLINASRYRMDVLTVHYKRSVYSTPVHIHMCKSTCVLQTYNNSKLWKRHSESCGNILTRNLTIEQLGK